MSNGAVGDSTGSTRLWNNLCLRDRLDDGAQAAVLVLRREIEQKD